MVTAGGGNGEQSRDLSPPRSDSHGRVDEKVKREEKPKREYSSTHNPNDDHTSSSHNKRPKVEPPPFTPSTTSAQPPQPPPAPVAKQAINLGLSGKLAAHANTTVGGSILKYQPPADAALPTLSYRLYCFPTATATAAAEPSSPPAPLYIHSQSLYRIGREPSINDLVIPHHSVSKQHAILQYRHRASHVTPYLMDVGSVNGTTLNGRRLDEARYVELRERDVLVFGQSGREYVLLHGDSRAESGTSERKEASGLVPKEQERGAKKRPVWADSDDDDV